MSSWKELVRTWLNTAPRRRGRAQARSRLNFETLEARDVPSITVAGTPPVWQSVGPGPGGITNGGVVLGTAAQNVQVGAFNNISVDPFDNTHLAAAAVNGGIWTTRNYPSASLTWTTTTDNLPSLAISSVAFSPIVQNVIYASTGSYTAGGLGVNFGATVSTPGDGGASVGIYKSVDGGTNWTQQGATTFAGMRLREVVPTKLNAGSTIFTNNSDAGVGKFGLYQSNNGGATWARISGSNGLPDLGITSIIADPGNANRFYTVAIGGPAGGVYMLDVTAGNVTWVNISNNLPTSITTGARVILAASPAGVDPIYAAVISPANVIQGVFRAVPFTTQGGTSPTFVWTAIGPGGLPPDISPGNQADIHSALVADPTSDRIVYIAGDRTSAPVGNTFPGAAARGDAIANTWTTITQQPSPTPPANPGTTTPLNPSPQPATAPHADTRGLVFVGTNTILSSTDGGLYQVTNPRAVTSAPVWSSINANVQTTEIYQADIDNRGTASTADDLFMIGAQDNGESEAVFGQTWVQVQGGDGTIVRADATNGYRYYSAQNFFLQRRNPNGTLTVPATTVNGGGALSGNTPFIPIMVLNQADTNSMLVGGNFRDLYLSVDHANTFTSIGGPGLGTVVPNVTSTVTASAYGTVQIRNAAYVATDDGNISQSFDITSNQGNFKVTNFATVAAGEVAINIVMDRNNPLIAYAVTGTRVFRTTDAATWTDITGTLAASVAAGGLTKVSGLALFNNGTATTADDALLVGGYGGVYLTQIGQLPAGGGPGNWLKLGGGLPNVVVSDLRYDALADTLVAGTYGRGEFRLLGVSNALINGPTITVTGNSSANTMAVYQDPGNSNQFIVADGLGLTQTFSLDTFRKVVFKGLGGADTIIVGSPAAATPGNTFPLALNISVDAGGDVGDTLVIQDAGDQSSRQVTVTPTVLGGGIGDTLLTGNGSVAFTGLNAGSVQFLLGAATGDKMIVDDSALLVAESLTITSTAVTRSLGTTYNYSGVDQLAAKAGSGPTTFNLRSTAVPTSLTGGSGNDTFNIASDAPTDAGDFGAITGGISIDGGTGADAVKLNGTAGDDFLDLSLTTANGDATVSGLPVSLSLKSVQSFAFDGRGGSNAITIENNSGTGFGTPTTPAAGTVFAPSGAASGTVRIGTALQVGLTAINAGLTLSGAGAATGDTLLVLGTSAPGLQSAFGEAVVGDGRDVINVTDTAVQLRTLTGNPLLGATINPTFGTIYVAAGNEAGTAGDQITVTASGSVNLVVDGMAPIAAPGDQLTITGSGPFTQTPLDNPTFGPPQIRYTGADGSSVGVIGIERTGLNAAGLSSGMIAVASDVGPITVVQVYDRLTHQLRFQVTPFDDFTLGVTVASGDVNGDGVADLIVGAGPGGGPRVSVFSGFDGALLSTFFAYDASFRGGVNVSTADFNNDGHSDIVLGTGPGGGPRVRVISGADYSVIRDVFVFDPRFRGGVNVAAGDFNADGTPDLITSAGPGGGPQIVVLSGIDLKQLASFFIFDPNSRAGFYIASADVNGDGYFDVIGGAGAGDPAHVRVISGLTRGAIADFYVNDPLEPGTAIPSIQFDAGIRVAAADVNGDGIDDVITAKGPGSTPTVRIYQVGAVNPQTNALFPTLQEIQRFDAFDGAFGFGLYVGGSD